MFNIIRADIYRVFRAKGIYITTLLFVIFVVLQVAFGSVGRIGLSTEAIPVIDDVRFTGATAAFATMNVIDNYLYFLLPIIIFIAAADFSSGTIKNVLASGVPRTKLYISKLALSLAFSYAFLVLNVVLSILTATVVNGFGGDFDFEFIKSILTVFVPQLFLVSAVISVGIFFVFVTQKTAAVNAYYIGLCMVPMLFILVLSSIWTDASKLFDYELVYNMRFVSNMQGIGASELIQVYSVAAVYIIASTAGGLAIFRRSEIK